MQFQRTDTTYIVVLEKGEKVMETLTNFCVREGIQAGAVYGIGAVREAEIAYYDLGAGEYLSDTFAEDHEVLSLMGNISQKDDECFIHAHIVLGNRSMEVRGGHLREAEVAVTLEVRIEAFATPLTRTHNEDIGLHLLSLEQ